MCYFEFLVMSLLSLKVNVLNISDIYKILAAFWWQVFCVSC